MNYEDLKKLLDYIQENNSWENMYDCHKRDRYTFKYVDVCIDTRDDDPDISYCHQHVWHIKLRNGGMSKSFRDATFDDIKKFLDQPMKEVAKQLEEDHE